MKNIVALVSGGGTNLQTLLDAQARGELKGGRVSCVISSKPEAYALERAKKAGVPTRIISRKEHPETGEYSRLLLEALREEKADLVVLAGFLTIFDHTVVEAFPNRIINIHPALIPSFCGKGFYGLRVHQAVLDAGVKLTGATVHFVTEEVDGGPVILQKAVPVRNGDTPETLQKRVMEEAEWVLLPKAAALFCQDKIQVMNGKAVVQEEEPDMDTDLLEERQTQKQTKGDGK